MVEQSTKPSVEELIATFHKEVKERILLHGGFTRWIRQLVGISDDYMVSLIELHYALEKKDVEQIGYYVKRVVRIHGVLAEHMLKTMKSTKEVL